MIDHTTRRLPLNVCPARTGMIRCWCSLRSLFDEGLSAKLTVEGAKAETWRPIDLGPPCQGMALPFDAERSSRRRRDGG